MLPQKDKVENGTVFFKYMSASFLLLYRLIIIYFLINYCSSLAIPNLFTKLGHRHAWIVTFSICGGSRSTSLDKEKLWRSFFN